MVRKVASGEPKKPYSVPVLTVYGKVSELTQTHRSGAHPDGGKFPLNKGTSLA
jgi:hypothetical protein